MTKLNKIHVNVSLKKPPLSEPYNIFKECVKNQIVISGCSENSKKKLDRIKHGIYIHNESYYARKFFDKFLYKLGKLPVTQEPANIYDTHTCMNIKDIPKWFYFETITNQGIIHAYDIRSITVAINPYTMLPFSDQDLKRYKRKKYWLDKYGYGLTPEASVEPSVDQLTIDVFCKISQFFYVDSDWFTELNIAELKSLYKELHDIWNSLDTKQKIDISGDGIVCPNVKQILTYTDNMENKLRHQLLFFINKLVKNPTLPVAHQGATYFMIGFVMVSQQAMDRYPSLAQSVYYSDDEY